MRSQLTAGLMIAVASAVLTPGLAATPKNALGAIAVSPDGATLVAAGDNRVLYVLDPASLEVKARVHLGINPLEAFFSKDGKTLAIFYQNGDIRFYSSADWSETAKVTGAEAIAVAAGADTIAAIARPTGNQSAKTTVFTVYALGSGAKTGEASIAGEAKSLAAAADGSAYAVLTERTEDAGETKQKAPAELKGVEKEEFEQKNDGYASEVVMLDGAGKETARVKTWYSTSEILSGAVDGGTAYFLGYSNKNLKIAADGTASLFKAPPSYLYGLGIAPDGKSIAAGSLRDGAIYKLADGAAVTYELDKMEGWPEYFEGFGYAPDGSVYGGTSGYRLAHIGADGVIKVVKPIY